MVGTPTLAGITLVRRTAPSRSRTRRSCVAPPAGFATAMTWAPPATAIPGAPFITGGTGPAAVAMPVSARQTAPATTKRIFMRSSLLDGGIHRPGARGSLHADTVAARVEPQPLRPRCRRPLRRVRRVGDVARRPARGRRALPGATRGRLRRSGRGRPPPARLGVLAGRPPARGRRVAGRRPVFVPPRGGGAAEPPGLAVRAPLLAARRVGRRRVGVQPDRPAFVRPRGRDGVLVAAGAWRLACRRARRRPRLLPDALPGRPVDGPPARAHLLSPAGDAARAGAAPIRGGRRLSGGDPALGPAPPRAGGDPARARLRVGAHAAGRLVEGGHRCRGCARRGSGRRPLGRGRLDRNRTLVRPGRPVLGGGLGLRHAGRRERHRGARVRRVADAARGDRGLDRGPPPWPRGPARAGGAPPLPARPRRQPPRVRDPLATGTGARRDTGARAVHADRVPRAR